MGGTKAAITFSRWAANSGLSFLTPKAKRGTWPVMRPTVFIRQRQVVFSEAALVFSRIKQTWNQSALVFTLFGRATTWEPLSYVGGN